MSKVPTDEEILTLTVTDPRYEETRLNVQAELFNARLEFMRAQAAVAEWSQSEYLGDDSTTALNNERSGQLRVAQQRMENVRARYGYWRDRWEGYKKPAQEKATTPAAREASKG